MYTYSFRSIDIFKYDPEKDELLIGDLNMCHFITEDYKLMTEYFETIHKHKLGEKVEFKDIEVY